MILRKVGVLTGGGDVPGLNVAIKTLTDVLADHGVQTVGLRRGWASLLALAEGSSAVPSEWVVPLDRLRVRTVDRTGGTFLHSSRTNPAAVKSKDVPAHLAAIAPLPNEQGKVDLTKIAARTIERLGLDALVAIGGDDTLSFAKRLHLEGVPVIGIPKTMDNDVPGTTHCIGFSTAVSRSVEMITALRTPAGSHERFLVVELFGRDSGETSLTVALLSGAERAVIPEVPFDMALLCEKLVADRRGNPSSYAVVTISEGAKPTDGEVMLRGEADAYGHRKLGGIGQVVADYLQRETGIGTVSQHLGYLMRSGPADVLDRMVALNFARNAAALLLAGKAGTLMAIVDGCYATQPLTIVGGAARKVDIQRHYDAKEYRPKLDSTLGLPMFLE
ncbi:MAG: 6-phosphofructokinase [Acidobacteriota bacterium]